MHPEKKSRSCNTSFLVVDSSAWPCLRYPELGTSCSSFLWFLSVSCSPSPFPFPTPLTGARHMIPVHDRSLVASARPSHPSSFSTSRATAADQCPTEYREHLHAPGSRTRILEAVRYCCGWQNLQSVCGPSGAYLTVSELQYHTDNDVLLWVKLNLNTVTYAIFCKRVWGREQAFAMQLVDHSTECP